METNHDDFYKRLRKKVEDWFCKEENANFAFAEYVLIAPDIFYLLTKLVMDKDVPVNEKKKLGIAIAYFISPIDIIPDFLPPIGFLDDVSVAAYALNSIINNVDPEIVQRHWAGKGDILEIVKKTLQTADTMIGSGLWGKIKKYLGF